MNETYNDVVAKNVYASAPGVTFVRRMNTLAESPAVIVIAPADVLPIPPAIVNVPAPVDAL